MRVIFVLDPSVLHSYTVRMLKDILMLKRLDKMGAAKGYSIRDARTLLVVEGYRRPSLDFIAKRFRWLRGKRIKRIL